MTVEKRQAELPRYIYPCKVPFSLAVKNDRPCRRAGTYYPDKKRLIIEYAHHLHHTEFDKEKRMQKTHGKQFWQIYGQLIGRAKALGIYEDENIPALLFPDVAETVSKLTPQNHALNTIEKKGLQD